MKKHTFERLSAGNDGNVHYNYSQCTHCGIDTQSYLHGDFKAMEEAERLLDEHVICLSTEELLKQTDDLLAEPFGIFK